jgi:hypothetical protein
MLRRRIKCFLPWWSRMVPRRIAQVIYDLFRLKEL